MTEFGNQFSDGLLRCFNERFERSTKVTSQVWRYADCVPIGFRIAIAKSLSFSLRQTIARRNGFPFGGKKLRAPHDRKPFFGVHSHATPFPHIREMFRFIPVRVRVLYHEMRLPVLLTSGNHFVQFSCPFSLREFGLRRRPAWTTLSSVATWLPGRIPTSGLFSAETFVYPNVLGLFFPHSEKSAFIEVDHDHRP